MLQIDTSRIATTLCKSKIKKKFPTNRSMNKTISDMNMKEKKAKVEFGVDSAHSACDLTAFSFKVCLLICYHKKRLNPLGLKSRKSLLQSALCDFFGTQHLATNCLIIFNLFPVCFHVAVSTDCFRKSTRETRRFFGKLVWFISLSWITFYGLKSQTNFPSTVARRISIESIFPRGRLQCIKMSNNYIIMPESFELVGSCPKLTNVPSIYWSRIGALIATDPDDSLFFAA